MVDGSPDGRVSVEPVMVDGSHDSRVPMDPVMVGGSPDGSTPEMAGCIKWGYTMVHLPVTAQWVSMDHLTAAC